MWRKSSRSETDHCVEVTRIASGAVRDSKNPTGPTLTVDLSTLLMTIRAGKLDR